MSKRAKMRRDHMIGTSREGWPGAGIDLVVERVVSAGVEVGH